MKVINQKGNLAATALLILFTFLEGSLYGAAYLGGLSGNETPIDSLDPLSSEYGGPAQVFTGVFNKDDDPGNATLFLSAFGGGVIALRYSPTYGGNGVLDREYESGGSVVYGLDLCGVNSTTTGYIDAIYEVAQDANLTAPSYGLYRLSANGTGLSFEGSIALSTQPTAMTCTGTIGAGQPEAVFLAMGEEVVAWDSTLSSNDTLSPAFVPTALAYMGGVDVTGTPMDVLVVGGSGGEVAIYEVNGTRIGDSNSSNAFTYTGLSALVDGAIKSISIYTSPDVDTNDTSEEALIFVGTSRAIYLFELDDNGSNPNELVLETKGDLTSKFGVTLDARDIFVEPAGDQSLRNGFLILAAGASGTLIFKTGGEANGGLSALDTFYLTYLATFPTGSQTLKVVGTGGSRDSTSIERIYILEGGGGLKVLWASGLTGPGDAQVGLSFNWSPVVEGRRVAIYEAGGSPIGVLLNRSGEVRLYDLSTSGPPQLMEESSQNSTGCSLFFSSSQRGGEAMDLFMAQDPSDPTTLHLFSAMAGSGLAYCRAEGLGTASISLGHRSSSSSDGPALAIHGFEDPATNIFTLGVAMGDAGASLFTFDPSSGTFSKKSTLSLGSTVEAVYLYHDQEGEDYLYTGGGGGTFYVFKVTRSGGGVDYLSNPVIEGVLPPSGEADTTFLKVVVERQGDRYYGYLLGSDGRLYVVDCTNPSSPTLIGSYPQPDSGDPGGITDFSIFEDGDHGKWYALCASTNTYSSTDDRRLVFTLNITDPANIRYGNSLPLDPTTPIFVPMAVAAMGSRSASPMGLVAALLGSRSGPGILGAFSMEFTGPKNLAVSFALDTCPTEPGSLVTMTPVVSGGEPPYTYTWSESSVVEVGDGTWQWNVPLQSLGTYELHLSVVDSDGNIGSASRSCRVEYRGVSVEERLATPDSKVRVPVRVSGIGQPIDAWGISIQYDREYLEFLGVATTDDTLGWTISVDDARDSGVLQIGGVSNGFPPIPQGASATLFELIFSVRSLVAPGTSACLAQELAAGITPSALNPSQLMGDLEGAELHSGRVLVVLPGDVDGDLCVTPQDALDVFLSFLGVEELRQDQASVGDLDRDGVLSPNDAIMILDRYLR